MNSWTLHFTDDLAYADDAAILRLSPRRQCPPINVSAAPLGLSYGPRQNSKTWEQVTRR